MTRRFELDPPTFFSPHADSGSSGREKVRSYETPNINILQNARESRSGLPFGLEIAHYIQNHPGIERVNLIGLPYTGKTTIVDQLMKALSLYESYSFNPVYFDNTRAKTIQLVSTFNPAWADTAKWPHDNWHMVMQLQHRLELKGQRKPGTRLLTIHEIVGIDLFGRMTEFYLGHMKNRYHPDGTLRTLTIFNIGDPRILFSLDSIRPFVIHPDTPALGLKNALKERGLDVGKDFDNSEKSGNELKQIFNNMGKPHHVLAMHAENDQVIKLFQERHPHEYDQFYTEINLPLTTDPTLDPPHRAVALSMRRDPRPPKQPESELEIIKRRAALANYLLSKNGINKLDDGGTTIINILSREKIHTNLAFLKMK